MPNSILGRAVDWDLAYEKHGPELRFVEMAIAIEEENHALSLTPAAVELLLLPFLEEFERNETIAEETVKHTIRQVMEELIATRDSRDYGQTRSAFSVIRAWWGRWCDIPPICRPVQR